MYAVQTINALARHNLYIADTTDGREFMIAADSLAQARALLGVYVAKLGLSFEGVTVKTAMGQTQRPTGVWASDVSVG